MSALDKVYVSTGMLQRELGVAQATAKALAEEAGKQGDTMTFDSKVLYNRAAVQSVLRNKHSKLLAFLSNEEQKAEEVVAGE